MPLEQDIRDLVAELKISNALRREDLDFRKQLYAAAANTSTAERKTAYELSAPTEAPALKKPTKGTKPEVAEPTPEPAAELETNTPPTEPSNPDPAPAEPDPAPAEPDPAPAEPVAEEAPVEVVTQTVKIEDILDFQRSILRDTTVEVKKERQAKLREVLAEFGAKATTELKPEQLGAALARMKEVVG